MDIPLSRPSLGRSERQRLVKALKSGWLTQAGSEVRQMEESLEAKYLSIENDNFKVTTTSNGTTALHLALLAAGVGPHGKIDGEM